VRLGEVDRVGDRTDDADVLRLDPGSVAALLALAALVGHRDGQPVVGQVPDGEPAYGVHRGELDENLAARLRAANSGRAPQ